mmetsp:Transcript_36274/g.96422  ORF Transcript_36274/g.96422 Transcript_36274/m.96422 type:complete len:80 (-) Transcript_36274:507-746(-)
MGCIVLFLAIMLMVSLFAVRVMNRVTNMVMNMMLVVCVFTFNLLLSRLVVSLHRHNVLLLGLGIMDIVLSFSVFSHFVV